MLRNQNLSIFHYPINTLATKKLPRNQQKSVSVGIEICNFMNIGDQRQ